MFFSGAASFFPCILSSAQMKVFSPFDLEKINNYSSINNNAADGFPGPEQAFMGPKAGFFGGASMQAPHAFSLVRKHVVLSHPNISVYLLALASFVISLHHTSVVTAVDFSLIGLTN